MTSNTGVTDSPDTTTPAIMSFPRKAENKPQPPTTAPVQRLSLYCRSPLEAFLDPGPATEGCHVSLRPTSPPGGRFNAQDVPSTEANTTRSQRCPGMWRLPRREGSADTLSRWVRKLIWGVASCIAGEERSSVICLFRRYPLMERHFDAECRER